MHQHLRLPHHHALEPARDAEHVADGLGVAQLEEVLTDRSVTDGVEVEGKSWPHLVSQRGGDFLFDCGQDLSIGYDRHDADAVHLYLQESFSFVVASPDAAVALTA